MTKSTLIFFKCKVKSLPVQTISQLKHYIQFSLYMSWGLSENWSFPQLAPIHVQRREPQNGLEINIQDAITPSAPAVTQKLLNIRSMAWWLFDVGSMI